ncbi:MAG: glycosyltransferase family 2 protein [Coriobacteriales bacterium]|nr:glycosyltransferase family 2 protein [Coriobacteriales bacterium]
MSAAVSISIVTYNNEDIIAELLESLQTHCNPDNLDVHVVDNCSHDSTVAIVRERFPWAKVLVNQRNLGYGSANNRVLEQLSSKYHFIINPDILFVEDSISVLAAWLDGDEGAVIATPRILNPDGSEQKLPKLKPRLKYILARRLGGDARWAQRLREEYTRAAEEFSQPTEIENSTGCFLAIRTAALRQLDGFDERYFMYFEDTDLSARARKLGRIMFCPQTAVLHRYQRASTTNPLAFVTHCLSALKFFIKNGW